MWLLLVASAGHVWLWVEMWRLPSPLFPPSGHVYGSEVLMVLSPALPPTLTGGSKEEKNGKHSHRKVNGLNVLISS